MQSLSPLERDLNHALLTHHRTHDQRFTHAADCDLRRILFSSLANGHNTNLHYFFPNGAPTDLSEKWSLRTAQGAIDGAEYTAAAKGTACGHIFRSGESTYHCKTCALDDTCVLCSRCFEASDHEDHQVFVSVSPGNSGCCDCGDPEAWRAEVACTIHTADASSREERQREGKRPVGGTELPVELVEAIRMTIARCVDFLCDVFSCSPEQMRLPKTETGIRLDELNSRLSQVYGEELVEDRPEFALVLWNDEKHTVYDVQNQVARACAQTKTFGYNKAMEVNDIGRSVVHYSSDLKELLRKAGIIEQLKVTVTIRSSRDTFREHMCEAIVDWIGDIAGCAVGNDLYLLRNIVCEEMLNPWRAGSQASNKDIGLKGIDDHETDENQKLRRKYRRFLEPFQPTGVEVLDELVGNAVANNIDDDDGDDDEDNDDDEDDDMMDTEEDGMEIEIDDIRAAANASMAASRGTDAEMDIDYLDEDGDANEVLEATFAGYPPPPPPPNAGPRRRIFTPAESDDGEIEPTPSNSTEPYGRVPRTPKVKTTTRKPQKPSRHWLEKPEGFREQRPREPCEDLWQRVRLDFLILYDLRLWKILRIHLRHLYITTVVTIPHFKRILGLRFAGLYTALAQLYLIADREPDHSIINLSVQMLTTPTITEEVVERGNFLTNLMAILYTFLTTRQVGFPEDVSPKATLAFDAGAVTNRRMFHFLLDLRWLFQSEFILYRMRVEQRYLLQFLDLVKLHQGVCPNVRATGEHVEYESDTWISASMVVKEINKLCKMVGASFEPRAEAVHDNLHLQRALRTVAQVVLINSCGSEKRRFHAAEVKTGMIWHKIGPYGSKMYSIPFCSVQTQHMSFHHPLHYLLSWLIENAKDVSRDNVRSLLQFTPHDLKDPWNPSRAQPDLIPVSSPNELLCAVFEHPLRICVWLAQMKAGMWVRNGITLRHQAHTYRSVSNRDVGYQRDILMIQAGFVLCGSDAERPGERFLAQAVDRFDMREWIKGNYDAVTGYDESQQIDVIEDLYHLLVIVLSERGNLAPSGDGKEQHDRLLQHDIAHTLCFKPLSFSDLSSRLTEKVSESEDFSRVLESMTIYRPPEGLSDTGTFELKPDFIELVDPYYAHYSRNHREEAESIYRKHMIRKTGKKAEDVVYEPNLQPIPSGLFANLFAFTATPLFARVVAAALKFAAEAKDMQSKLQPTRIETFLHMVLHLVMIATLEDTNHSNEGFVKFAAASNLLGTQLSVVSLLGTLSGMDEYASCHSTIKSILRKMQIRQPEKVDTIIGRLAYMLDRTENNSPASVSSEDKERKKQEALARQARVMAQMKQQQNSFLQNQGLSGFDDDEFEDLDDMSITEEPENVEHRKTWSFPTGEACIWCQEETDDQRLYGTFAFLGESKILRTTPVNDLDFVKELFDMPESLDRPANDIRPAGVAGNNRQTVQKLMPGGKVVDIERQGLSKGFPQGEHSISGPVASTCGHIMHYSCFELYLQNSQRRHQQQIARNHPEDPLLNEFTCPLCKALGNAFLPIIWKAKECVQEHELHAAMPFTDWLLQHMNNYINGAHDGIYQSAARSQEQLQEFSSRASKYVNSMFPPTLVASMNDMSLDSPSSVQSPQPRSSLRRASSLGRLFSWGRNNAGSQSSIDTSGLSPNTDRVSRMSELTRAYQRMSETIRKNTLNMAVAHSETKSFEPVGTLSSALGLSISAFEIAHRGVNSDSSATSLLSELSSTVLTHFRIMSETIESYLAVNILRGPSNSSTTEETNHKRNSLSIQLSGVDGPGMGFVGMYQSPRQLFQEDIFLFFVDWLTFMAPNVAEAWNVLQMCYWAEVVKTVLVYATGFNKLEKEGLRSEISEFIDDIPEQGDDFRQAMRHILDEYGLTNRPVTPQHLVSKYALAFLRKCIVAMYVRYGLDFECPYNVNPQTPELHRLTALLHLPSIEDLCAIYNAQSPAGHSLRNVTKGWTCNAAILSMNVAPHHPQVGVSHPAIFELVGLPRNYDLLTEEAIKRKCPATGKEITDPAVCLLCGAIFCSQATCCMKEKNKGGCHQHMQTCGGQVGVFINIRKCMVVFRHGELNGSFTHAPYLDKHGETDPTLRRHHQLFLNQRRYDKLIREVWLQHLIPSVISRKLEADINPGGWETL